MEGSGIYISHAWGGESEAIVEKIFKRLKQEGLKVVLDKNDLGYRESINAFMQNLGQADAIILVVSNKYLHSEYCMFELLQIYDNKNILERIFPIVLDEVKIAKSTDRLDLVKFWESQHVELEAKIRELQNLSYIEGITDDLNLYSNIRNKIAKLTNILKDINTLNIDMHKDENFDQLVFQIKNQINKSEAKSLLSLIPEASVKQKVEITEQKPETPPSNNKSYKSYLPYLALLPIFILAFLLFNKLSESDHVDSPDFRNHDTLNQTETTIESKDSKDLATALVEATDDKTNLPTNPKIENQVTSKTPAIKTSGNVPEINSDQGTKSNTEGGSELTENPQRNEPVPTEARKIDEEIIKPEVRKMAVNVVSQNIEVEFIENASSNVLQKGQNIYLQTKHGVSANGMQVIKPKAQVKATVMSATPSDGTNSGQLGIEIISVIGEDNKWHALSYPEYSLKKRGEVIFSKGTSITKIKLLSFKTELTTTK